MIVSEQKCQHDHQQYGYFKIFLHFFLSLRVYPTWDTMVKVLCFKITWRVWLEGIAYFCDKSLMMWPHVAERKTKPVGYMYNKEESWVGILDSGSNAGPINTDALAILFGTGPRVNFTWLVLRDDPRCPWLQKYDMVKFLGCDVLKGHKIMLLHQSIFLSLFLSQFLSPSPSPLRISNLREVLSLPLLHLSDFFSFPPPPATQESCVYVCVRETEGRETAV